MYPWLKFFCGRYDLKDNMTNDGVWVFSRTNRLAMFKAWEPKAKLLRSSWNWNLVKPNLSSFGIPLCKISWTALTLGWSNFIWWQTSECPEGLARSNWKAEFISLRELHILWLGWSQNCWINWHPHSSWICSNHSKSTSFWKGAVLKWRQGLKR